MKISCGIILLNEKNEVLMGHSTGNKFYDIPKGMLEEGETAIVCAMRECQEESSLIFSSDKLKDLGLHPYNKEKHLHLFLTKVNKESISINELSCNSFFEHVYTKKQTPEVDGFEWIKLDKFNESCAKSMAKLLNKLIQNNELIWGGNQPLKQKIN